MTVTITKRVQFNGAAKGRKRIKEATPKPEAPAGRVPRISRLMALAIQMQRLIDEGAVRDYAELARLGHVSRARITQIMNLANRKRFSNRIFPRAASRRILASKRRPTCHDEASVIRSGSGSGGGRSRRGGGAGRRSADSVPSTG